MKNLDELGVQEMDAQAIKDTGGGGLLLAAVLLYVAVEIAGNPEAHAKAFTEGWNAA